MTDGNEPPPSQRQLSALAMTGGLVFYVLAALSLVVLAAVLWAVRFL